MNILAIVLVAGICHFRLAQSKAVSSPVVNAIPGDEVENPAVETGGNFEGDILVGPKGSKSKGSNRNAINKSYRMWEGARMCYFYAEGSGKINTELRERMEFAIEYIANISCVKFELKTTPTRGCVMVTDLDGEGCHATLGFVPISWLDSWGDQHQLLNVPTWCQKGSVIHECLHALGFEHEQSRPDRDDYIKVVYANIPEKYHFAFEKYGTDKVTTLNLPYDYGSVMHYSGYGFSTNGEKTIIPIPNAATALGQRKGMSELDIQKLNRYYKCPATAAAG